MNGPFFVFDVESVGLHGEAYAVGFVVIDASGKELESGLFACNPDNCLGSKSGRKWIAENCPTFDETHSSAKDVRAAFWFKWKRWKEHGAALAADCAWPVEARFLIQCVEDARPVIRGGIADGPRDWEGPYPLIDIGSILLAFGRDPLGANERLPNELPVHDPLADARQSARIFAELIKVSP